VKVSVRSLGPTVLAFGLFLRLLSDPEDKRDALLRNIALSPN
jgi:hypothetical protein